uniref:Serine/threonine protein phosphatase 2A regulatory subunit n=1 Tax=Elphidium margaritaceum TaxID=933848 RepID=A0A7S0TGN7_9EUKA
MCSKLELCAVCCDFQVSSSEEMTRVENKKDLLLEVLQAMSAHKWSSVQLLQQCIETIWENLFRSLPDASMIRTDANDDEMDFRDPSWDHLQLIYELTFHVVTNTNIDKKTMKKHLQGQFLEKLIHLFCSADDREPQYVKIIVHAIYGRFMALRKSIRKHLADYCFRYVYTSTLRDNTSWQGLPEILEIFCSIFQGLNVPVKPDYHVVLRNVIVPLHKSFHLDEFHEQLLQCCTQFVTKDPYSAPVILGGILKFWPKFSPLKEQLFITEIVHILNVCVRHPNIKQSDPAFATITIAVLNKFVECMTSPHHQVAERSLMVWRDETIRICVDLHREKIWPNIYQALQHNKEKYWLSAIRNINRQIMSDFKRRDPEFFEKIEQQQQSHDFNTTQTQQQKERKKLVREQRWMHLKQLAKPAQNV